MKSPQIIKIYKSLLICMVMTAFLTIHAAAAPKNVFELASDIIKDVYTNVAGISTVLAGLMSAVSVIGMKMSNNQHKTDQGWDWLKRIWIAWAVINGIGAFIAYVVPLFSGYNTLT